MAMLTFAFAQLLYEVAIKWVALTGGSDGLPGIGRPRVGIWRVALDLSDKRHMYWLVLAFVMLGYALARRVVESPFGRALVAVRESEERARAIGIDVTRHRRVALVFSGALAGLAGALFAIFQNFVSPELLFFALSGEVVVIALLGGLGTLYGSLVGGGHRDRAARGAVDVHGQLARVPGRALRGVRHVLPGGVDSPPPAVSAGLIPCGLEKPSWFVRRRHDSIGRDPQSRW
jgi:hypothetical protein